LAAPSCREQDAKPWLSPFRLLTGVIIESGITGRALRALTNDDEMLVALEADPSTALLDRRQRMAVCYA
jgi:hypothetical protein